MIYIDNPVGSGFSFTNPDGYRSDMPGVAVDLYSALYQFFMLFPWLQTKEFYIAGESYAGKYIPAIAMEIVLSNEKTDRIKINLKGLIMGNALIDPLNMLDKSDFLHQTGILDKHGWRSMKMLELKAKLSENPEQDLLPVTSRKFMLCNLISHFICFLLRYAMKLIPYFLRLDSEIVLT